jgi:hypothetical protein
VVVALAVALAVAAVVALARMLGSFHMMPYHSICFIIDATPFRWVSFHSYQFDLISL